MKVALLGDVHGNHLALKAVLDAARAHGAERLLVTGDLVGYYFWPRATLDLLEHWRIDCVRGNHEDMLAEAAANSASAARIATRYGSGIDIALRELDPEQLRWLTRLPHPLSLELDACRVLLCHGTPWQVDEYLYPDAPDHEWERFAALDCTHVFFGHTHHPVNRRAGPVLVVNPGSVGQPRNLSVRAHWGLLDTESGQVSLNTEPYDHQWVVEECRRREPNIPYLQHVLLRA